MQHSEFQEELASAKRTSRLFREEDSPVDVPIPGTPSSRITGLGTLIAPVAPRGPNTIRGRFSQMDAGNSCCQAPERSGFSRGKSLRHRRWKLKA